MSNESKQNYLALTLLFGAGSRKSQILLKAFGDPAGIFTAKEEELKALLPELSAGTLHLLLSGAAKEKAGQIFALCQEKGIRVLCPDDSEFPASLKTAEPPPTVLFCVGKTLDFTLPAIGVVGTRHPDAYGLRQAYKLSFGFAAAGMPVVSGLAMGIDALSAVGTVKAGGHPIAVLGCGIDVVYPKQNTEIYKAVAENGTLISEYLPGTPPNSWQFPARNRLIAALSDALAVVEAGESSGALITARHTVAGGKPVFALPGDVENSRSFGCNKLLQHGARVLLDARDVTAYFWKELPGMPYLPTKERTPLSAELNNEVLAAFGLPLLSPIQAEPTPEKHRRKAQKEEKLLPLQAAEEALELPTAQLEFYRSLPDTPFTVEDLVAKGISVEEAFAGVTELELLGALFSRPGGQYSKK